MPKRVRAHQLEDLSRAKLRNAFCEVGWTVEDLRSDYGEDLLVRIFDRGLVTPLCFFVQAKSTDSIDRFASRDPELLKIRVLTPHLKHWESLSEPVILTLWDANADKTYWACAQDAISELPGNFRAKHSANVPIYRDDLLDTTGIQRLRRLVNLRHLAFEREKGAVSALVTFIADKFGVAVQCDSHGVLEIGSEGNGREIMAFGDFRRELNEVSDALKMTPDETLKRAIRNLAADLERFKRTGRFPALNPENGKVEPRAFTKTGLLRHLKQYRFVDPAGH